MQSDQVAAQEVPAAKERKQNKAEKLPRTKKTAKSSAELVGRVDSIALDLAADAQTNLTFTLALKSGIRRVTLEAAGETRQTAVSLLIAAKIADQKVTVTMNGADGKESVVRTLALKSKQKDKN